MTKIRKLTKERQSKVQHGNQLTNLQEEWCIPELNGEESIWHNSEDVPPNKCPPLVQQKPEFLNYNLRAMNFCSPTEVYNVGTIS